MRKNLAAHIKTYLLGLCLLGKCSLLLSQRITNEYQLKIDTIEVQLVAEVKQRDNRNNFVLSKGKKGVKLTQKGEGTKVQLELNVTASPLGTAVSKDLQITNGNNSSPFISSIEMKSQSSKIIELPHFYINFNFEEATQVNLKGEEVFIANWDNNGKPDRNRIPISYEIELMDTDKDGVPDVSDKCVDKAGKAPTGCPEEKKTSPPVKSVSASENAEDEEGQKSSEGLDQEIQTPIDTPLTRVNVEPNPPTQDIPPEEPPNNPPPIDTPPPSQIGQESGISLFLNNPINRGVLIAIAVLLGIILILFIIREKQRKKNARTYTKSTPQKETHHMAQADEELTHPETNQSRTEAEEEEIFAEINFEEKTRQEVPFPMDLPGMQPHYFSIDLEECWADTVVKNIHLHKLSISQIYDHIRKENTYQVDPDTGHEIPEIGGFLMGFLKAVNHQYDVCIERFIPITPDFKNKYTVKFGDRAWIEWSDAQTQHPDELLLGWFHTHPGHGLFLSEADIKVHKDQFSINYLIAMEIDTLTPDYDTAFFTWKDGEERLNNADDCKRNGWYSFVDMERETRRKIN